MILNFLIVLAIIISSLKLFGSRNSYEKILTFYFISTQTIILIIYNSAVSLNAILDIALVLLLLQMAVVLFLILHSQQQ